MNRSDIRVVNGGAKESKPNKASKGNTSKIGLLFRALAFLAPMAIFFALALLADMAYCLLGKQPLGGSCCKGVGNVYVNLIAGGLSNLKPSA